MIYSDAFLCPSFENMLPEMSTVNVLLYIAIGCLTLYTEVIMTCFSGVLSQIVFCAHLVFDKTVCRGSKCVLAAAGKYSENTRLRYSSISAPHTEHAPLHESQRVQPLTMSPEPKLCPVHLRPCRFVSARFRSPFRRTRCGY